jgi:[ribosomal protein S5]-alanine N-acetyltransferase
MKPLETERLVVRNFKASDWEALYEMIVQYEASEYAKYDQQWPTTPEEIKGVAGWFAGGDNFLAVCLKDNRRFIGFVAFNPEEGDNGPQFNLGYVFNADYHSKGYASEACRAVLNHTFGKLGAQKVVSGTAAANQPSCRLLERLGFRKTGEDTGSFQTDADGKPVEFLGYRYAMTRDQWQGRRRSE